MAAAGWTACAVLLRPRNGYRYAVRSRPGGTGWLVEVLTLDGDNWKYVATFTGGDVVRVEPFPEAEVDLASIWGPDEE
jgi:hypothetical protein